MRKIYAYIISVPFFLLSNQAVAQDQPADSIDIVLKLNAGIEVAGPVIYFKDKTILNIEGYFSADMNEKMSLYLGAGYSDFKYSQYNYDFLNKGIFFKAGVDFNLLKPETASGKYWAGIGLRYGLSSFNSATPFFKHENYWGITSSSVSPETNWGHYLEASPGFKAEIFRNFSIGWSISLRKLLYTGSGKDLKPIYIPGYGKADKSFSAGISYFLMWNIPYKRLRVAIRKESPEESTDQEVSGETENSQSLQNIPVGPR